MVTQQTILRAELNNITASVTGITNLVIANTAGIISYSGTGTNNDPYIGSATVPSGTTTGWAIVFQNLGDSGILYYDVVLPEYTGVTSNFFESYRFSFSYNDNSSFYEYGISDISAQNIRINKNDYFSFGAVTLNSAPYATFNVYFIPDDVPQNQLVTYENLDLYSDIPITINKSFAELEDIGKRNSDYSVGLSLPGSKKNNRFFENFYDVDSSTLFFDVTKRVPIKVLIDDESYLTGYMRLNKVNVLDSKIEYDVTLFSTVGDLFGQIGNGLLKDLDFNDGEYHFNHFFTLYNVTAGWQGSPFLEPRNFVPLYNYPALHNGYLYSGATVNPSGGTVASQSRFYTSTVVGTYNNYAAFTGATGSEYFINSPKSPLLDNQLKPALSVWGLIKLIFKSYGYTIKSDFFNTPWFKALYMYGYFSSDTTKFGYQVESPQTLPIEDVELLFVETFIDETVTCGGSPQIKTTRTYTMYVVKAGTGIPCLTSGVINANLKFRLFKCDSAIGTDYTQNIIIPANSTGTTYSWVSNGPYPIQPGVSSGCAPCAFEYQQNFVDLTTSNVGITTRALAYTPQQPGTFVNYVEYDSINFSQVIDPKIKQIDFLSSIAKKFNLIFVPNTENPKEIIIEPYDFYIGTGDILDWTDKLSFDKGFTVQPALNYVESELVLTDLEDGDDGNKQFKDQNNRIYGENYVYNETDFKSQQKKIDTIFSPEIIRKWDERIGMPLGINYAASSDLDSTTNRVNYVYKGVKTKPKLMFNLGNFSPFLDQVGESINVAVGKVLTMFFRVQQSDGTNPLNDTYALTFSSNPIISHTIPIGNPDANKINNDSLCVLFNSEQPIDTIGIGIDSYNAYTDNDIYNTFYINRVSNLYNKSTRFLSGNFYLKQSDVKNLKVNDLIKINNQYFTWNKIEQYNLTNTDLTKVELIQYNSEYSTYPNRFFKYNYCGDANIYKFRTFFNPADNPDANNNNSLYYSLYYWSVFYDYMVGVLGGNVSSITTSFPLRFGSIYRRWAVTITEITENEYNTINYYYKNDPNQFDFIGRSNNFLTTDIRFQNPMLYCFSNVSGYTNAFFNVAVDCATFTGYCATNYVELQAPPTPFPLTPTPTPTQTNQITPTPSVTRTPVICVTHTPTPTTTSTPTVTPTITSTVTPTVTVTPTKTITPTPTPTPTVTTTPTPSPLPTYYYDVSTFRINSSTCTGLTNKVIKSNVPISSTPFYQYPNPNPSGFGEAFKYLSSSTGTTFDYDIGTRLVSGSTVCSQMIDYRFNQVLAVSLLIVSGNTATMNVYINTGSGLTLVDTFTNNGDLRNYYLKPGNTWYVTLTHNTKPTSGVISSLYSQNTENTITQFLQTTTGSLPQTLTSSTYTIGTSTTAYTGGWTCDGQVGV
jgi:hypothetical protein